MRATTIKVLEENTGVSLCDLVLGSLLRYDAKAQVTRKKKIYRMLSKLSFYSSKEIIRVKITYRIE